MYQKNAGKMNAMKEGNIKKLAQIFPGVIKDGAVSFEALKEELGYENICSEKYGLMWAGKEEAKKKALEGVTGKTLKYVQGDGTDVWDTGNVYVEGGNLEALKLLLRSYCERIGLIYIDPPYNTGINLVYGDGFVVSQGLDSDGRGSQPGKYGTAHKCLWGVGHEDWLGMMYPRLKLARELLSEDGVIFISIDDNEQANLKIICDEIFGSYNFLAQIIWEKPYGIVDPKRHFSVCHEYILCYAKNKDAVRCNDLSGNDRASAQYAGPGICHREPGKGAAHSTLWGYRETGHYRGAENKLKELFGGRLYFRYPKPVGLIKRCIKLFTDDDSLVLDFFATSAVTAHAVMELNAQSCGNRKYILVQAFEKNDQNGIVYGDGNICEIVKEHLRLAGGKVRQENPNVQVDTGFRVFRVENTDVDRDMDAGRLEMPEAEPEECMHGADDTGVVYELMLMKYGVPLSETLERLSGIGSRTYLYAGEYLVCLESEVTENLINKLVILDPLPTNFIFRDSAFMDDELKEWVFRKLGISSAEGIGTGRHANTVEFI